MQSIRPPGVLLLHCNLATTHILCPVTLSGVSLCNVWCGTVPSVVCGVCLTACLPCRAVACCSLPPSHRCPLLDQYPTACGVCRWGRACVRCTFSRAAKAVVARNVTTCCARSFRRSWCSVSASPPPPIAHSCFSGSLRDARPQYPNKALVVQPLLALRIAVDEDIR